MRARYIFIAVILLVSIAVVYGFVHNPERDQRTETIDQPIAATISIDEDAVNLLSASLAKVGELSSFTVWAQTTFEDIDETGRRVDIEMSSMLSLVRPNKLHIERHGTDFNQIFYYDGKSLTLHNPNDHVHSTVDAPDNIDDMLHFIRDEYGISTPISDLMYSNSFDLLMYSVTYAEVIGKEMIGNQECTHLLFSRPGVDFQIWIADDGSLLPRKYSVTDTGTEHLLAISTVLNNWDSDPSIPESAFQFEAPENSSEIMIVKQN